MRHLLYVAYFLYNKEKMKNIILDTDIGGDCDDVGALVMCKSFAQQKLINLCAVTSCTTVEGAEHCIYSVLNTFDMHVPMGIMTNPPFMCKKRFNIYARIIKNEFPCLPSAIESVSLIRKTLSQMAPSKATIIAIGPARNLHRLLLSCGDIYSPLCGVDLVKEKVEQLIIMAGCFLTENQQIIFEKKNIRVEWNVEQDIKAARYVSENWPTDIVYSPFELGYLIKTGKNLPLNTASKRCYEIRGDDNNLRESWDPCAAYYGSVGCGDIFKLSSYGKVSFDKKGFSTFVKGEGRHKILLHNTTDENISAELERWMK